jgi:hypothetical protein
MTTGAKIVPSPVPDACRPALADAFERLLACAQQSACPDAVLQEIRALMSDHGLLLR